MKCCGVPTVNRLTENCFFFVRMYSSCQHLKAALTLFVCLLGKDAQAVASPLWALFRAAVWCSLTQKWTTLIRYPYSFGWISTEQLLWKRSSGPAGQRSNDPPPHLFFSSSADCVFFECVAIVDLNFIHNKTEVRCKICLQNSINFVSVKENIINEIKYNIYCGATLF